MNQFVVRFAARFADRFITILLCWLGLAVSASAAPLIYAWQGGETGVLQNSLPAFMLATGRADAVHLRVVATKDDQLLLLPTPDLARFTDVAAVFPERLRSDGSAACVDFTLAEIRRLRRLADNSGKSEAASLPTSLTTLDEILAMDKIITSRFGQEPTLVIELVEPAWHRQNGKDLSALTLQSLDQQKIAPNDDHIILMSEDSAEMQRLAKELLPPAGRQHRLIQMIGPEPPPRNENNPPNEPQVPDVNEWAFTQLGLRVIATYAAGVAIDKSRLVSPQGTPSQGEYLARAKKLGLLIFVYPVGPDDTIPRISTPTAQAEETPRQLSTAAPDATAAPVEAQVSTIKASDFFLKTIGADGLFFSPLPLKRPSFETAPEVHQK
ncbi:MAG: hypothetical protein LBH14_00025 [Desulfobulbaceae bacterium]|jgi:glycerophosphoryl diester phosphodiesterase|nr:hypothetical protein [Desulfobulbaceae bacterium]